MKKKIILYFEIIVIIFSIMFVNESYSNTTNTQTIDGFLYNNTDHFYRKKRWRVI